MSVLVGGVAGSSSRLSGGILTAGPKLVADVQPANLRTDRQRLSQFEGKLRRIIRDTTLDSTGGIVYGALVKVFRSSDDSLVDRVLSDDSGVYEASVYDEDAYYAVAHVDEAAANGGPGHPALAGATIETLRGV